MKNALDLNSDLALELNNKPDNKDNNETFKNYDIIVGKFIQSLLDAKESDLYFKDIDINNKDQLFVLYWINMFNNLGFERKLYLDTSRTKYRQIKRKYDNENIIRKNSKDKEYISIDIFINEFVSKNNLELHIFGDIYNAYYN